MIDPKQYIKSLLNFKGVPVAANRTALFEKFVSDEIILQAASQIIENQKMLTEKWRLKNRIADIQQQPVSIPNGTVGKAYQAKIDFVNLKWNDIIFSELEGLDQVGLIYDNENETISGIPTQSGDVKIILRFRVDGEPEDSTLNEKIIPLIINPDPKSLWKTKDSDRDDPYWKEDNVEEFAKLGDRHIVVASKRGRSHANVGSFRDDDYAFKHYEQNGWSLVVVADGAGSAKFSRKGSEIACKAVVDYFDTNLTPEFIREFDEVLMKHHNDKTDTETGRKLSVLIYETLSKAAYYPHQKLVEFAKETETNLKDFYSTLIFTLFRKYELGYAFLSFGVGDCPIVILNKDLTDVTLMNWLDVGEFGGGTRFINMPEIFLKDS